MFTGMIILLASACAAAIFAVVYRLRHTAEKYVKMPRLLFLFGIALLILGTIFTIAASQQTRSAFMEKSWPAVQGYITSSVVVGQRAFRPDIEFQYVVDGDTLHGSSSLNQPGFGGRMNRLDAAEKEVHEYGAGKTVRVHYEPGNPQNCTLSPGPTYAMFLKLGNSSLLFLIGLTIVLIKLFQPTFRNFQGKESA